jgi:hypothetical protein
MSLILSGLVNVVQLAAGIPTLVFLDSIGRRKLAIIGGFAMAIPHLIMAGIYGRFSDSWISNKRVGWLGVALICKKSLISVTIRLCVLINLKNRYLCCLLCCFIRAPRLGSSSRGIPKLQTSKGCWSRDCDYLASQFHNRNCGSSDACFAGMGHFPYFSVYSALLLVYFLSSLSQKHQTNLSNRSQGCLGTIFTTTRRRSRHKSSERYG